MKGPRLGSLSQRGATALCSNTYRYQTREGGRLGGILSPAPKGLLAPHSHPFGSRVWEFLKAADPEQSGIGDLTGTYSGPAAC